MKQALTFARRYKDAVGIVAADGITAWTGEFFVHLDADINIHERSPVQAVFTGLNAVAAALEVVESAGLGIDASGGTLNGIAPTRAEDALAAMQLAPDVLDLVPFATFDLDRERLAWLTRAMAKGDIRHYLNALSFDFARRRLVACDGHRMHIANGTTLPKAEVTAIMPRVAVEALLYHRATRVEVFSPEKGITLLLALFPGGWLLCRNAEGTFPDVDRVTPARSEQPAMRLTPTAIAIIRAEVDLLTAQNRAAGRRIPMMGVGLHVEDGMVRVSVPALDAGEPRRITILPIDAPTGRRGEAFYRGGYLVDALASGPEIDVHWTDTPTQSAGLFTAPNDPHLSAVVMPIRP